MPNLIRSLILIAGLLALAGCSEKPPAINPADIDHYTCAMHPSVHSATPGKCPICGMDLVPVKKQSAPESHSDTHADAHQFTVPVERQQQIGLTYGTVERRSLARTIRALGAVQPDPQRSWTFVARADGYVRQIFVTSPGELVEKEAPLLAIYSPELLSTERELVTLLRLRDEAKTPELRQMPEQLIAAAKARLRQWNVTDAQLAELEKTRAPEEALTLRSPFRGIVQEVAAAQGVSVKTGERLVSVADLSVVWITADFYESELAAVRAGQPVTVSTAGRPEEKIEGEIALVNPFVDPAKRTGQVRINLANPELRLRPGMFANVELRVAAGEALAIPVSAILPAGARNLAFVDLGAGKLEPRVVELGGTFGDFAAVKSGVAEGERVVTSANFLIDAEAKLQGALDSFANAH